MLQTACMLTQTCSRRTLRVLTAAVGVCIKLQIASLPVVHIHLFMHMSCQSAEWHELHSASISMKKKTQPNKTGAPVTACGAVCSAGRSVGAGSAH